MAIYLLFIATQVGLAALWVFHLMGWGAPQAQIGVYIVFVLSIVGAAVGGRWIKKSPDVSLVVTEGVVTLLWVCSLWQMTLYPSRPWLAERAYVSLMLIALALKLFWPSIKIQAHQTSAALLQWGATPRGVLGTNFLAALFIFLVIYIPHPENVVGWFYFGEQFHQWDGNFMGVDYGLFHGLLPDVDVISTYGFGLPVYLAGWMKFFGGLSYANALKGMFWTGIIYYILWFFLLRQWFKSALLAFAAVLLGMRMQMFDQVVVPMCWVQVPASIVRYCFDVIFFWAIYGHIRTQRKIFLGLAALTASIAMVHMMSTGTLLLAVLVFYAGIHVIIPSIRGFLLKTPRDFLWIALIIAAVPVLMFFWTWLIVKDHAFTHAFWANVTEYNNFFYNNVMTMRLSVALDAKEFLYLALGLSYPLLYIGTVLYVITMLYFKKLDYKFLFAAVIGIYGFFLHAYYILVSSKYSTVGLPGIFLAFFWVDHIVSQQFPAWRTKLRWGLLGTSLFCLLTAHMFTGYPNLLNFSPNPIVDPLVAQRVGRDSYYFNQLYVDFPETIKVPLNSLGERDEGLKYEKDFQTDQEMMDYYNKDTDFSQDTQLIRSLTPPDARVPLISSFDVLLLWQAQRRPYFYFFPLLNSHPMRMRNWMVTLMLSRDELAKMIAQLERDKPKYIFMERVFLTPQVHPWYGYEFEDLIDILRYVLSRYEPTQVGQYLVAMRRKE